MLVLAPFAIAAAVFGVSRQLEKTYSSSALVRVNVVAPQGLSQPAVIAENEVAAQYALLGHTAPVLLPAATALGVDPGELSSATSVGTASGRNLIDIQAKAPTAAEAVRRANAVAAEFLDLVRADGRKRQSDFQGRAETEMVAPFSDAIRDLRARTSKSSGRVLADRGSLLANLQIERQRLRSQIASDALVTVPTFAIWAPALSGSLEAPRPRLYAAIAFLLSAALAAYAAYALRRRTAAQL